MPRIGILQQEFFLPNAADYFYDILDNYSLFGRFCSLLMRRKLCFFVIFEIPNNRQDVKTTSNEKLNVFC